MKCETCLNFLEEYLDGELLQEDAEKVESHLITCNTCSAEFSALTAEQELFTHYDREIEVPASLWNAVAAETMPVVPPVQVKSESNLFERLFGVFRIPSVSFAGAAAVLLLALVAGAVYLLVKQSAQKQTIANKNVNRIIESPTPEQKEQVVPREDDKVADNNSYKSPRRVNPVKNSTQVQPRRSGIDQSDVLSTDFGSDLEDQDTAKHLEQTQNLLRSIRNTTVSDADDDVDVSYDKALSRRLLNENIVLRRDAEMKAKYPTKVLLTDLEPFLIDIANLPDRAKPEEVRQIKERVEKTEIVAALSDYQGRVTDNR